MKFTHSITYIISALTLASAASVKNSSLRGYDQHDDINEKPWDELKCTLEAKTQSDVCSNTRTKDGLLCNFCTLSEDDKDFGLCVDPLVANKMKEVNREVSCSNGAFDAELDALAKESVQGPFEKLRCTLKGKTSADQCSMSKNKEGDDCAYCKLSPDGNEAGLCVDPEIADQMKQMNQDVTCSTSFAEEVALTGPFDELKCSLEGKADAGKCASAVTADGSPCSFCTMEKNGQEAGLCVNPDIADQMMHQNGDVSCTNADSAIELDALAKESVQGPFEKLRCTLKGKTSADQCSMSKNKEGDDCAYCKLSPDGNEAGLCVDPEIADQMKQMNQDVTCSTSQLENNPIKDCNLSGVDHGTCVDPSKVNGSICTWCDAGIGGFCFPKSWEKTAGRFMNCGSDKGDEPMISVEIS